MKQRLLVILCTILLFSGIDNAYAGFTVKKKAIPTESSPAAKGSKIIKRTERAAAIKAVKKLIDEGQHKKKTRHSSESGWEGIVALCCGILGIFTGWLAIPAIIFGAIGMRRGAKNRNLAIAGFVLGVVGVVILILAVVFLLALMSWMV